MFGLLGAADIGFHHAHYVNDFLIVGITIIFHFPREGIFRSLPGPLNMGCGLGAYYNGEIDLYLTGPDLFLYPIYDIPVAFFEGIGGRPYHWKAAVDVGYSYAVDGIPLTLNLYARSLLFWQDNRMGARFDTGVGVGIYIKG